MTEFLKPPTPMYMDVIQVRKYKVQALCKRCGEPMLTKRFYCQECHEIIFPKVEKVKKVKKVRVKKEKTIRVGQTAEIFLQEVGSASESEIAKVAGVSRQRIHQIEKRFKVCHLDPKKRRSIGVAKTIKVGEEAQ